MNLHKTLFLGLTFLSINTFAQVYSDKIVGKKNEALKDSLKTEEYPYSLPIWGKKVTKLGYDLPYSAGVSVNYFWQKSDLTINNLNVGFNNGNQFNLDQVVRFTDAYSNVSTVNIRPDIWLLPFLNVYGIFAQGKSSTAINAGIWVPDGQNNWTEVFNFGTKANFDVTSAGIGITPTIGIGGGWLALDMNMAWTDVSALDKPAFTFIFGPRFGKSFKFAKPERNIAVWVGAFRVQLKSETQGNLLLSDLVSLDGLQTKVDNGIAKVDEKQTSVNNWWDGLTPVQKANPVNAAKYAAANKALDTAGGFLANVDGALSTAGNSTVQYSLEKAPTDKWNFIIGSQFQYNKHIMFRAEYGFLGSREQFLAGIQYRFGL